MIRGERILPRDIPRKPRASGDDPFFTYPYMMFELVNPARAGMIRRFASLRTKMQVNPARAGMIRRPYRRP